MRSGVLNKELGNSHTTWNGYSSQKNSWVLVDIFVFIHMTRFISFGIGLMIWIFLFDNYASMGATTKVIFFRSFRLSLLLCEAPKHLLAFQNKINMKINLIKFPFSSIFYIGKPVIYFIKEKLNMFNNVFWGFAEITIKLWTFYNPNNQN